MYCIISTVGTTVFGGYGNPLNSAVREFEASKPEGIERIVNSKSFPGEDIYRQALEDLKAKTGTFLRKACAETNAIEGFHEKYGVQSGNVYHFLSSQTPTGLLAARVLKDFCLDRYQASHSDVRLVQGLQVTDERKFRLEGLPFLIQVIYELMDSAKEKRLKVLLNPTGGFKAVIPYMTLIGMIRGVEVGLIHETSQTLITLAGLPVALDLSKIGEIEEVLEQCDREQETGIHRNELAQGLGLSRNDFVENHSMWSLFEQYDNDHYILSGLGSIALVELRKRNQQKAIYLSDKAVKKLAGLDKNLRTQLYRIFEQMRDKQWVEINLHATGKDKLKILKASGAERPLFYWDDDGAVVIADIGLKNDGSYDGISSSLDSLRRADYPPVKIWDGKA